MRYILLILLFNIFKIIYSQNLVPNPSFEKINTEKYPTLRWVGFKTNITSVLYDWYQPTIPTPFVSSSNTPPNDIIGHNYVELYSFCKVSKTCYSENLRSYLAVKLDQPLIQNEKYILKYYLKIGRESNFAINNIGVALSIDSIYEDTKGVLKVDHIYAQKDIMFPKEWTEIVDTITAKGGERFLAIGNFYTNKQTNKKRVSRNRYNISVYNFDYISLSPVNSIIYSDVKVNDTFIIKNLQFDFDSVKINPLFYEALDSIVTVLKSIPFKKVTIIGHTDDKGSLEYNQKLSQQRAENIRAYLILMGFDPKNIQAIGKGMSEPITDNQSESDRFTNRRVEFFIEY